MELKDDTSMDNVVDTREMAPGFRFYPTEEELVSFYLEKKLQGTGPGALHDHLDRVIPVLDVYEFDPRDLPQYAGEFCQGETEEWFFFIPRREKEARGGRPCRLTSTGYWKATGSPSCVYSSENKVIGMKRTMVFYLGRAPSGRKTEWKMNEYKVIDPSTSTSTVPKLRQEMSLSRVYVGSKSVRAFDRRPPYEAVDTISKPTVEGPRYVDDQSREGTSSSRIRSAAPSPDHTSSSRTSMELDSKDVLLWDWEQLNWF